MVLLVVLTLLVALAALAAAVRPDLVPRRGGGRAGGEGGDVPADVLGLRQEVAALRAEAQGSLRHLAVVRYDAFGGEQGGGGRLSWSVALVDDSGAGVVLTSITGRSEVRSYAKAVAGWSSEQPLSPEETEALEQARPR